MQVTVLGSGSRGNSILVESGSTRILVDAGFSGREIERRLAGIGVEIRSIDALVVTHEHVDHTRGMGVLARRFDLPLHLTPLTAEASSRFLSGRERIHEYRAGIPFSIGTLEISPFLTVHDAADPVAVSVTESHSGEKLGIATDLGRPNTQVRHALENCHILILEANHDEAMLRAGPYPRSVQARIASSHGHLSNHMAASFGRELLHDGLGAVVLAHLSAECNTPGLALEVVGEALTRAGWSGRLSVAPQDRVHERIDVGALRRSSGPAQLPLL